MVGGDAVDRAVRQAFSKRVHVGLRAQGRVDFVERVVGGREVVGEQQVVRGDLGGDIPPLVLRPPQQVDAAGGADMADVQPAVDVGGEQAVTGDDRLLRHGRPTGQAEQAGLDAFVHLRADRQPRLLRVLGDDAVEGLDVFQRPPHEPGVTDASPVVGEDPHAGGAVGHRPELGHLLTAESDGDRTDWSDVAVPRLPTESPHLLDDARRVGDRIGVGHRVHRGEPAESSGEGACLDGLGVLPTGFAQVGVQVHQAGQQHRASALVDPAAPLRQTGPDLGDAAVDQTHVGGLLAVRPHVPQQVGGHAESFPIAGVDPPSSR